MTLIIIATWYLYVGAAVAAWFILYAIGRLDENAESAWIFRPLLVPGVLLIWPLVLWRCLVLWRGEEKLDRHRMPRKLQDRIAIVFVFAVPLILILAVGARQDPTRLAEPIQLEAAE